MDSDAFSLLRKGESEPSGLATKIMRAAVGQRLFETEVPSIDRFRVLGMLGAGAMGSVYEAYDPRLDRRVAVKVLRTSSMAVDDREALLLEARALARLTAPEVVTVFEAGLAEDTVFIAMEFLDGGTLRDFIVQHPAADAHGLARTLDVLVRAGRGLQAAHEAGLIHRDFKPSNVLLGCDGRVKVADFGLARSIAPTTSGSDENDAATQPDVTAAAGTPAYIAPEARRGRLDARSDQFSFCVAAWEALFGARPFPRAPAIADDDIRIDEGPELPPDRAVSSRIRAALTRGLARDPEARFASMAALLVELAPVPRRRRLPALAAISVVAVAAVGATYLSAGDEAEPCGRARELVTEVWSEDHAAAIRDRFGASDLAFAQQASLVASARLQEHAERWVDAHTQACRATRVDGHQSDSVLALRMACLDERRRELDAVASTLVTADARAIENTRALLGTLAPIESCADVDRLDRGPRPPVDPDTSVAVDALRTELARLRARAIAGERTALAPLADEHVATARALDYEPVLAEALLVAVARHSAAYELELAEAAAREAIVMAARHGQVSIELRAWGFLLAGFCDVGAPRRAVDGLPALDSAIARAEDPPAVREAQHVAARAFVAISRFDEAAQRLELAEQTLRPDDPESWTVHLLERSRLELARGDPLAARDAATGAALLVLSLDGPEHPLFAETVPQVAIIESILGHPARARDLFELAFEILERTYGPDHSALLAPHNNLAVVYENLDRIAEARTHLEHAERIAVRDFGPAHAHTARVMLNLARMHRTDRDLAKARETAERALAVVSAEATRDDPMTAAALEELGEISLAEGVYERADAHFHEALSIRERAQSKEVSTALLGLARSRAEQGDREGARPLLAQLVAAAEANDGSWPGERFLAEVELARLDAADGDLVSALARLQTARSKARTLDRSQYLRTIEDAITELEAAGR